MKKNGFTLIELLAVIAVLGIILTIVIISTNSIINKSAESAYEIQLRNIEEAAKTFYLQEGMSQNINCVSLNDLISKGYIESTEVIDPRNKEVMGGAVTITQSNNKYQYEYNEYYSCES